MSTAAQPHGPFQEILPDVFLVTGSFGMAPLMTLPRNMIVVRSGRELALLNPIRLSPQGEEALEALGSVKHVLRIGLYHNSDVPYVRQRFSSATFWDTRGEGEKLVDGERGPFEGTRVFAFKGGTEVESALLVDRPGGNLLITCDSIQNWADTSGCSFVGGLAARMMGFITPAKIGPIWLKNVTQKRPAALRPDFDRLLSLDFSHLVAGHGVMLRDGAKAAIENSCRAQGVRDR